MCDAHESQHCPQRLALFVIVICCVSGFGKSWKESAFQKRASFLQQGTAAALTPALPVKGRGLPWKRKINNAFFMGAKTSCISFGGGFSLQDQCESV